MLDTRAPVGQDPGREKIWGLFGTGALARQVKGDQKNFYINPGHANASDDVNGTDPLAPLATLQSLIDRTVATNAGTGTQRPIIETFDNIFVSGDLVESVTITDWSTIGAYCNLIGVGNNYYNPVWQSEAADEPCLILGCNGWRVQGFRFSVPSAQAAIVLPATQAPYGANATGTRVNIAGNFFDGSIEAGGGLYGIDLHGAPWNVEIRNNSFGLIANAANTSTALVDTNTGFANPRATIIEDNWFWENDNDIVMSLNMGLVRRNAFSGGGTSATIQTVDLRGGSQGRNMVYGNAFGDADYSNAGGFWSNAANPGGWAGNSSEDTAEAEVGDNGWTIAPPA